MKNQSKIVSFFAIVVLIVFVFLGYSSKVDIVYNDNTNQDAVQSGDSDTKDEGDIERKDEITPSAESNSSSVINVSFDKPSSLVKDDKVTLPDGLTITLVDINDSRCPTNVMCVWSGEVIATLLINGGRFGAATDTQVTISTVRNPKLVMNDYEITLIDATDVDVSLTVKDQIGS